MKFLRFETQAAALAAFDPWIIKGQFPAYIGTVAASEVGTVHKPKSDVIEGDMPVFTPIEGYWVYLSARVPELQAYEVDEPEHVAWVYAGWEPNPPPPVPNSCTRRQGLLALLSYGIKRADIEAAIESIEDETQREAAWIEYLANDWELGNPTLQALWLALGGAPEQLDDLFRLATTL